MKTSSIPKIIGFMFLVYTIPLLVALYFINQSFMERQIALERACTALITQQQVMMEITPSPTATPSPTLIPKRFPMSTQSGLVR